MAFAQKGTGPSFIAELKLNTGRQDDKVLDRRFFIAFRMYNRMVTHARKCLRSLRQDKEYRECMAKRMDVKKQSGRCEEKLKKLDQDKEPLPAKKLREKRRKLNAEIQALKKEEKALNEQLGVLQSFYGLSEAAFHAWIKVQQHRFKKHIDSNTAQKIATRVWGSVKDVMYRKGKTVHYKKLENVRSIEGKSNAAGIRYRNGKLLWNGLNIQVQLSRKDKYLMKAPKHDVRYCRIVRKAMGTTYHYYLQLILQGTPPEKHWYLEDGDVGIDPGISCEAVVSDHGCLLAEIEPAADISRKIRMLQRKMDRSRRANNPDNYNPDGTMKKKQQRKPWVKSKIYKKDQMQMKTLRRRNADTLEQNETKLVNRILTEHGTNVATEKMDYRALQAKAKQDKVSEKTGRHKSRKLFGGSIAKHAPSRFLAVMERKLSYIGKTIFYVDTKKFRASQYDHVVGDYQKCGLDKRWKTIGGTEVQRDLYSAFLLKNAKDETRPDRIRCRRNFRKFVRMQNACIRDMKQKGISKPAVFGF